ncbi:MAG: DNA cytosine methyltransferase [Methanobrevibacter olleyae]|uniref:DNA (cytosine-5-)-methyltransferase n=1 Tax=Methanobrevibacter olleyae TaxID=294671 RepID=A0A8T3VTU4_METOL|nr:DNA cytosine methyltransferase [Methanobrevibacter olleyae]
MAYAIDLFCGAGGMSEGILQAGFKILFSSDINEAVQITYMNRHKQLGLKQGHDTYYYRADIKDLTGNFINEKISKLDIFKNKEVPQIDVIFGGPPCQGFSRAGKRDPNDPRNMLFKEYLRVIRELQPKYVVLENVGGFADTILYDFEGITGNIYEKECVPNILKQEFQLINYGMLEPQLLNAADYGVPQSRNRMIIIAYKEGMKKPKYPKPTHNENNRITLLDAIGDLIKDESIKSEYNPILTEFQLESIKGRTPDINGIPISSEEYKNIEISNHLPLIKERFSLFLEGESGSQVKKRILEKGIDLTDKPKLIEHIANKSNLSEKEIIDKFSRGDVDSKLIQLLLTKKNMRRRLSSDEPSGTVLTIPDDYISPFENRTLTVRESARLQSFDDSFEFLGKRTTGGKRRRIEVPQYSQVGNAVPPLLAKAVALELKKVL